MSSLVSFLAPGHIEGDAVPPPGLLQLMECFRLVVREELAAAGVAPAVRDDTAPFRAEELCVRWHITGKTDADKLRYLARKCRLVGLRALKGGDGWNALYRRADVVRAEELAAGKIRGRKKIKGRVAA